MNKLFKSIFLTLVFASNIVYSKTDSEFTTGLKFLSGLNALHALCLIPTPLGDYPGGEDEKLSCQFKSIIAALALGGALYAEENGCHKTALGVSAATTLYLCKESIMNACSEDRNDSTETTDISIIYNLAVKLGIIGVTGCAIYKTFNQN